MFWLIYFGLGAALVIYEHIFKFDGIKRAIRRANEDRKDADYATFVWIIIIAIMFVGWPFVITWDFMNKRTEKILEEDEE